VRDLSPGHGAPIFAVSFDSDARRLVSAGADGFARIWYVAGARPIELAHPGKDPVVLAASFSPDGARVATADFGKSRSRSLAQWRRPAATAHSGSKPLPCRRDEPSYAATV
jgi:WD40 repeat protein